MIIAAALTFFFETGAFRHIDLTADDGLDPCIQCSFIKFHRTIHGTMVCDGDTVHTQFFYPVYKFLDFCGTVQQAVFRMDMQMRKRHHIDIIYFLCHITHLLDF